MTNNSEPVKKGTKTASSKAQSNTKRRAKKVSKPAISPDMIRPYDPSAQQLVIRERFHTLELINERFSRLFRIGLFNLLRKSPDVEIKPLKMLSFQNFTNQLPEKTNLNLIQLNPLRGSALFIFSPELTFIAVDNLFGGEGKFADSASGSREVSPTEQRILKRLLTIALESYEEAWRNVLPLKTEFIRSETQIKFTHITSSAEDMVVVTPFMVEIGQFKGEFSICISFSILEPYRELLTTPPVEEVNHTDTVWRDYLTKHVKNSVVELVCNFAELDIKLSRILKVQQGDIIPIAPPDKNLVYVDNIPVIVGNHGSCNGQYAIRVEELISPISKISDGEDLSHE